MYVVFWKRNKPKEGVTTHDIRCTNDLIWLIALMSVGFGKNIGCFQQLLKVFALWPLSANI